MHLILALPQRAPDRDAGAAAGGDRRDRRHPQVVLNPALDDAVHGLPRRAMSLMPGKTTLQPAVRALHGARGVVAGDMKRRAFVEHQSDV